MVINKDNTESYGSVNWSTYPGGSGSFLMDSGSLQTGEAWIVLITLDAELTDLSILDSLDDFHPDVLAAEFLLSDTVEIDGIGIAQEDITVNN